MMPLKRLAKRILRLPAKALLASSTPPESHLDAAKEHVMRSLLDTPGLAAKFYPIAPDEPFYVIPKPDSSLARDEGGLPIPPKELCEGYFEAAEQFLAGGRRDVARLRKIVEASGFPLRPGLRVLDFGCASGRMIRWFRDLTESGGGEVWGVDIGAPQILWCQQHLSPPFYFATSTSFPHLPFEDRTFDLIYAGSVFTHISELADAWLLELRRIVRPGGRLWLTVHDAHSIEMLSKMNGHWLQDMLRRDDPLRAAIGNGYSRFAISRSPKGAQVFYDIDELKAAWGRYFDVLSVTPEAHGYQTAVLLMKRV